MDRHRRRGLIWRSVGVTGALAAVLCACCTGGTEASPGDAVTVSPPVVGAESASQWGANPPSQSCPSVAQSDKQWVYTYMTINKTDTLSQGLPTQADNWSVLKYTKVLQLVQGPSSTGVNTYCIMKYCIKVAEWPKWWLCLLDHFAWRIKSKHFSSILVEGRSVMLQYFACA